MEHVEFLRKNGYTVGNGVSKDLISRATGRFYTHELVGRHLVEATLDAFRFQGHSLLNLIDPFCGDGRLICWLMEAIASREGCKRRGLNVHLWDCDEDALREAGCRISEIARKLSLDAEVKPARVDTFQRAPGRYGQFDLVITNPPWEVLKPDRRELQQLGQEDASEYVAKLRQRTAVLAQSYPLSMPSRRFAGWGINLARCGTEVALRLCAPHGVCGIVSPSSLLADQVSEKLRRWIFSEHVIHDLAYYPAEARLFDQVDQPSMTLVAASGRPVGSSVRVTIYDRKHGKRAQTSMFVDNSLLEATGFTFPLHLGSYGMQFLPRWHDLPTFSNLEGPRPPDLWAGRELDETRRERYLANHGNYLFLKGRMVERFGIVAIPREFVRHDGPRIPRSADHFRVAWRDVSRPSQKRRIHATLIPPGWVTGNSLNVAYFRDDNLCRLKALLGVMNSLVFEFQVRAYLGTAHVSLGTVRRVHVPRLSSEQARGGIVELTERCLSGDEVARADLEVQVAKLYGLSQQDFAQLVSAFDKLDEAEVDALMSQTAWSANPRKCTEDKA